MIMSFPGLRTIQDTIYGAIRDSGLACGHINVNNPWKPAAPAAKLMQAKNRDNFKPGRGRLQARYA